MIGAACKRHGTRSVALVLAGTMLLSACAQMSASGPMTPEQQQLHESNTRFATTTAEGALLGMLAGAAIGASAGGGRGAAIGAGAGLLTGTVAGYLVAQNNYTQARTEKNYQAAIADAQAQTSAFQRDAALAEAVARQAEIKAAQLQAQFNAHSITAAQYRGELATYQSTIKDLDAKNAAAQKQLTALNQSAAVTPGSQGVPFQAAARSIDQDNTRIAAAKERLRRILLQEPATT